MVTRSVSWATRHSVNCPKLIPRAPNSWTGTLKRTRSGRQRRSHLEENHADHPLYFSILSCANLFCFSKNTRNAKNNFHSKNKRNMKAIFLSNHLFFHFLLRKSSLFFSFPSRANLLFLQKKKIWCEMATPQFYFI
uniref:Uncharacterized protein n=1 Tax=Cacopsylla melanoneura TaxID=428564 RepID=A0A8D8VQM5_9HEMI